LRRVSSANPRFSAKSQAEINNLIFGPGFSTALEVTSISGRGVGMDIVRSNIEQIGGTVDVKSSPGSGTSFVIKNSADACHCRRSDRRDTGERFAFPQLSVARALQAGANEYIMKPFDKDIVEEKFQEIGLIWCRVQSICARSLIVDDDA
jgi:chemotaxis protein histidine kinase CheA